MDQLENAKTNFNLLSQFPGAKRVGNGAYRVNPCPVCDGKDHFTIYEPNSGNNKNNWWTFTSFNGCCKGGSPVDYFMEVEGLTKIEAISKLTGESPVEAKMPKTPSVNVENKKGKMYDFSLLVEKLHRNAIEGPGATYYKNRGLDTTIDKYKLGYAPGGYTEAFNDYPELKININNTAGAFKYFIPILDDDGKYRYIISRHDNSINNVQKNLNMKGLSARIFNDRYLINPPDETFIFICEGWADALTFEEAGYNAIALNSVGNKNNFIDLVNENKEGLENKVFVLALDNDKAGSEANAAIGQMLAELGIATMEFKILKWCKDINEYLSQDREACIFYIKNFMESVVDEDFTSTYMLDLITTIAENKDKPIISSGFNALDKKLGGGIYPGLFCLGAGSSLGKTTFALQLADNIAETGQDVLYFSLEMSKMEMTAKSLVREMFKSSSTNPFNPTTREFLNGKYNHNDLMEAYKSYEKAAKHIAIIEGGFDVKIKDIRSRILKHIQVRKTKPVVFIDYLQILKAEDLRMSDKQAIDNNITALKIISREFDIPVIVISSINRANYLAPVSYESFKESGSIEYTCDVIIGLQLAAVTRFADDPAYQREGSLLKKREEYNKAKTESPRMLDLVILKNRNGDPTASHRYQYYPKYNHIVEVE